MMTPVPEEDTTHLVEALHDKLHALQDAAAVERDVHITGHAGTTSQTH